eukprot:6746282-Prymnesium_polylepis.1
MQWSGLQCSLASERGLTVAQYHQRKALSRPREQSSRGEECQTSPRDQGEQPDGRVLEFIDGLDVGS